MANYYSSTRTNYFRVKDPDAFKSFMMNVYATEDNVEVWEEIKSSGTYFGFGCYGSIMGVPVESDDGELEDFDYEEFISGLSEHVADDDAILIMEVGNEKLRYLVGEVVIVTSKGSEYMNMTTTAAEIAAKMLGNENWKTKCEY